jgi:hypothetical protein
MRGTVILAAALICSTPAFCGESALEQLKSSVAADMAPPPTVTRVPTSFPSLLQKQQDYNRWVQTIKSERAGHSAKDDPYPWLIIGNEGVNGPANDEDKFWVLYKIPASISESGELTNTLLSIPYYMDEARLLKLWAQAERICHCADSPLAWRNVLRDVDQGFVADYNLSLISLEKVAMKHMLSARQDSLLFENLMETVPQLNRPDQLPAGLVDRLAAITKDMNSELDEASTAMRAYQEWLPK